MIPKLEPARWYAIAAAVIALVGYYVDLPAPLFLALAAAVLGVGGEAVRSAVTPLAKLRGHDRG